MSKRALFAIALMLFSMFFGAGNLIFPPMLGANAGDNFVPVRCRGRIFGRWRPGRARCLPSCFL